jgi:hypothetical protein
MHSSYSAEDDFFFTNPSDCNAGLGTLVRLTHSRGFRTL